MKIRKIKINDYIVLPRIDLDLEEGFNVIYGPNGSGKTLIIEAVKKLLGKEKRKSRDYPRGEITIMEGEDKILTFTGDKNLEEIVPITQDRLENIFITIDGALNIENGKEFYEKVVTDLIGINISDIDDIQSYLQDLGRFTSNLKRSDSAKHNKPSSQIKKANSIRDKIKIFLNDSEWSKERSLEYENMILEKNKTEINSKLENLRKAKKIKQLDSMEAKLKDIKDINIAIEKKNEDSIINLENGVNEYLKNYEKPEYYQNLMKKNRNFWIATLLSTFLFYTISGIFYNEWGNFGFSLPIFSLFISIYFFLKEKKMNRSYINQKNKGVKLLLEAKNNNYQIDTMEELEFIISNEKEELKKLKLEKGESLAVLKHVYNNYNPKISFDIENMDKFILEEKEKYKISEYIEYDEDLEYNLGNQKDEINEEITENNKILNKFNSVIESLDKEISLVKFEEFMNKNINWEITNLEALEKADEILEEFVKKIETDYECAFEANEIFEEIYNEESEKMQKYMNEETEISKITEQITDNFFQNIRYDAETDNFLLIRNGRKEQKVGELSSGELSQLYFAIRLALAKCCIDNCFLIFEDPFMYSDDERLERQIKILSYFVSKDWQVIIFTAKQSLREKLEKISSNNVIELYRID